MASDEQLANALKEVRLENAARINRVRAVATGVFTLTMAVLVYAMARNEWLPVLIPTACYFGAAVLLHSAAQTWNSLLRLSQFAVPILDIPMVFIIQATNMHHAANPGSVAEFTLAILILLVMLASFTLSSRQIYGALILAIPAHQALQIAAGTGLGGRACSVIVLGVAGWMCAFSGRAQVNLVGRITSANARRTRLQRYFSPGVAELLEEHDHDSLAKGEERELSVMFTDIRGFTTFSENLSGKEVVRFLNAYYALMVGAVFEHGGTLDKYLGDGLMAYFNAPIGQPDHAKRAILCALKMQHDLSVMNMERQARGQAPTRVGIGIHTGKAVLGDIGAPHRKEFTAIGDAVNVASRLENLSKELGTDIVVSETTVAAVEADFEWMGIGLTEVRGRAEPVRVYTLAPAADSLKSARIGSR